MSSSGGLPTAGGGVSGISAQEWGDMECKLAYMEAQVRLFI
jgi:hypothetical protein